MLLQEIKESYCLVVLWKSAFFIWRTQTAFGSRYGCRVKTWKILTLCLYLSPPPSSSRSVVTPPPSAPLVAAGLLKVLGLRADAIRYCPCAWWFLLYPCAVQSVILPIHSCEDDAKTFEWRNQMCCLVILLLWHSFLIWWKILIPDLQVPSYQQPPQRFIGRIKKSICVFSLRHVEHPTRTAAVWSSRWWKARKAAAFWIRGRSNTSSTLSSNSSSSWMRRRWHKLRLLATAAASPNAGMHLENEKEDPLCDKEKEDNSTKSTTMEDSLQ